MKHLFRTSLALLLTFTASHATAQVAFDPVPVSKTRSNKVYAHVMPWFESKEFSGYWGSHWTMDTRNPDVIDASGKRQIAAHYYPMIGPYGGSAEIPVKMPHRI